MSDLELRLRNRAKGYEVGPATFALLNDAADRIAQLEEECTIGRRRNRMMEARIAQLEAELVECRKAYGNKLSEGSCVNCGEPGALCDSCAAEQTEETG